MTGVDEVVGLLAELRDADGIVGRAAVFARGARAIARLTPDERRRLAVLVAERAAPQLVERIELQTGLDLTAEQVRAVVDMAMRLDGDQIDGLIAQLRDEEGRAGLATAAAGAVARELDGDPDDEITELEARLVERRAEIAALEAEAAATRNEADAGDEGRDEGAREEPIGPPGGAPSPGTPASLPPTVDLLPDGSDPHAGAAAALEARLAAARTARVRLAILARAGEDLWPLGPAARLRLVRALPDGWVRRRGVERMLEADVLSADEAPGILRTFASPVNRAWVAASMLESGVLDTDDLAALGDLLTNPARNRLLSRHTPA